MKYLSLVLFLFGLCYTTLAYTTSPKITFIPENQKIAFAILSKKCNVCHESKNPSKVFSIDNMNGFAKKINRQVFVWNRMPKGTDIKLNNLEKLQLKNWINSLK